VVGCPYEGEIDPLMVLKVAKQLIAMGCYEISLGDTIGVGTSESTKKMLECIMKEIPADKLAIHCHDTYGRAIENINTALELGIRVVDSSVAGLGGCPYADGATGNVATEKVLSVLHDNNMDTGVDIDAIVDIGNWISHYVNNPT